MTNRDGFILTALKAFAARSMQGATKKRGLGPRHPEFQAMLRKAAADNAALLEFLNGNYAPAIRVLKSVEAEIKDLIDKNGSFARTFSDAVADGDEDELPKGWRPDSSRTEALHELLGEFKEARRLLERRVSSRARKKRKSK